MGVILWRTGRAFAWGKGETLISINPFAEIIATLSGKSTDGGNVGVRARLAAAVELLGHKPAYKGIPRTWSPWKLWRKWGSGVGGCCH